MPKLPIKKGSLAILGICLSALLVGLGLRQLMGEGSVGRRGPQGPYPMKRQIQYSFTLQNETDHLLDRADFWTYGPVKETSTQRSDGIKASHPCDLTVDDLGNQVLHFTFSDLPPYGSKIVTITAELSLTDTPNRMVPGDLGDFVKPARYIESDGPKLVKLAQNIPSGKPGGRPEAFFLWVSENIRQAGYTKNDRGALDCLTRKQGDCTEQMYLFVALCRAAGIPARGVGGYVCDGDCILKASEYHNWAEFQRDGAWRLADPQRRVFERNPSRYIALRVIGNSVDDMQNPMGEFHRFRHVGEGLTVKMNQ